MMLGATLLMVSVCNQGNIMTLGATLHIHVCMYVFMHTLRNITALVATFHIMNVPVFKHTCKPFYV
jgi:hypothetical protein